MITASQPPHKRRDACLPPSTQENHPNELAKALRCRVSELVE